MRLGFKTITTAAVVLISSVALLTGCGKSKTEVTETADKFLAAIVAHDENTIAQVSSDEVLNGEFVKLFDVNSMKADIYNNLGMDKESLDTATQAEIDEFLTKYADNAKSYTVGKVEVDGDSAVVVAAVDCKFPIDFMGSAETATKVNEIYLSYTEEHSEEIANIKADQGDEAANKKVFDDLLPMILQAYTEQMDRASETTYGIDLFLTKQKDGTWLITDIKDFADSSAITNAQNEGSSTSGQATETATIQ